MKKAAYAIMFGSALFQAVAVADQPYRWVDSLFVDQFEFGDTHLWDYVAEEGGATGRISGERRFSGRYSFKCSLPASQQDRQVRAVAHFTESPTVYAQTRFYLESDFGIAPNGTMRILYPATSQQGALVALELRNTGSGIVLGLSGSGAQAAGVTVLSRGQWQCVEMKYTAGEGTGEISVWLNGALELSQTGLNLRYAPFKVVIGCGWQTPVSAQTRGTVFFDDMVVDDHPIGGHDAPGIFLYYPDFRGRVGAPVTAIFHGRQAGDRVAANLRGAGFCREAAQADGGD